MSATPVVHLPLPVPLEAMERHRQSLARQARTPVAGKTSGVIFGPRPPTLPGAQGPKMTPDVFRVLLGAGLRPRKNGLASALAFRLLRRRSALPVRAMVFAEDPDAERRAYALWDIEGVDVQPLRPQPRYWPALAACDLALHLDYRRTIGRLAAECAALGVPCVGTAGATMQRALWPDLIVEPWDVGAAAALADRLLRDPAFRGRAVARAAEAVRPFDLAPMAERFRRILRRFVPR